MFLKWSIKYPKAWPDPIDEKGNHLIFNTPFQIEFPIENPEKENCDIKITIESKSQGVAFVRDEEVERWKRKNLVIPSKDKTRYFLDNYIETSMGSVKKRAYIFQRFIDL